MLSLTESIVYEFDNFRIDVGKRLLKKGDGETISLTPKVFDTLLYLVTHNGKVVEKGELMSAIWPDTIVEENNLNKNISALRQLLGERPGEHRFIATVPGKGYKFVAAVVERPANGFAPDFDASKTHERKTNSGLRYWLVAVLAIILFTAPFYVWRSVSPSSPGHIRSIAVLPFKPMIDGERDSALELGMADTLILRLSDNENIIVRPLSSVRQFSDLNQDPLKAGSFLGVDSILDGSIQRSGDSIRLNVKLLRVADGLTLWSDTYDEKTADIFKMQDAISSRVASALALRVEADSEGAYEYTKSPEAYNLYWVGRLHQFNTTLPEFTKAIDCYKRAVEIDPNFALAYAGMADTYRALAVTTYLPSKIVVPTAKASALRAVELNDKIAETHIALGWVLWYDWDWKSAEEQLKRAIAIAPNNSRAHLAYAHLLSNIGRHEEAIAEGARARDLDPTTLITMTLEGQFLSFAGKDAEALERLKKTLEIDPNFWVANNAIARVYVHQGNYDAAIDVLTKAKEKSGGSTEPLFQLGYALAKSGQREKALDVLSELKAISEHNFVPYYSFAMVYNGLGDTDEALNYLERSVQDREVQLTFAKIDSRWDNLRSEPRFIKIMNQIGLE